MPVLGADVPLTLLVPLHSLHREARPPWYFRRFALNCRLQRPRAHCGEELDRPFLCKPLPTNNMTLMGL